MSEGRLSEGLALNTVVMRKRVVVRRFIGGGGTGEVYEVEWGGERKALKWLTLKDLSDFDRRKALGVFRQLFLDDIKRGAPGPNFAWPEDVTEECDGLFGYIMPLAPEDYYELKHFLVGNQHFSSFRACADACLNICVAFRKLHARGYFYQDLNAGNFFFRPQDGDVFIVDNDNVAPNGTSTGVVGTPGYMAPEIVRNQWEWAKWREGGRRGPSPARTVLPSSLTDRYSLAVIVFLILMMEHPLEGRHALRPVDRQTMAMLYGFDPIFMFDPQNQANAADPVVHREAIKLWNELPGYVRDVFVRTFSRDALMNQAHRVPEGDLIMALVRLRADTVRCGCSPTAESILDSAHPVVCEGCGRELHPPLRLVFAGDVVTPAVPGTRIYRCQVGTANVGEELDRVGVVVSSKADPKRFGLTNLTKERWLVIDSGGRRHNVDAGTTFPLADGEKIEVYGTSFRVERN